MIPEALLISQVQVATDDLVASVYAALQVSLTAKLDNSNIKLSDPARYLVELATFHGKDESTAYETLKHSVDPLTKFLHYTFLIVSDSVLAEELRWHSSLTCIGRVNSNKATVEHWTLATGTLDKWIQTTITGTHRTSYSSNYRLLMNKLILKFEELGLALLWTDYQRKIHPSGDKTFLLEYKP